ncbi:MAG: LptA/OstA family protein [Acidobacteriota bacterium]
MRVTTQGLRRWIAGAAALLLAVVAGFVIYGRSRFRHIEKDLPGRLGMNIQQTANSITFSQSTHGHTLFTLKAAKQVQLKSGHVLLHNVDITLYGPPGSGRKDRIAGTDFDYDQTHGVIVSRGDVDIELQGTAKPSPAGAENSDSEANTVRVKTSGLTFLQNTGEATTQQKVEFALPRAAGTAIGADYNSKTGVVVLDSQVHITTSNDGKPVAVDAAHATLLRDSNQALLVNAHVNYQTEDAVSDLATVDFRKDGSAEQIDAKGHVRMKTDDGAAVNAETAHILLDPKSQPTRADLGGGVQFASMRENETMRGSSGSGTLLFTPARLKGHAETQLQHGEFRENVRFDQQLVGFAKDPRGRAEKQLQAQKVDVDFAPAQRGRGVEARRMIADGHPVLISQQTPAKGRGQTMRIAGNQLVATLGAGNALQTLDGTGNTEIDQLASDGAHNTSRGDVLHASFVQQPAPVQPHATAETIRRSPRQNAAPRMQTTLETAVQDGHVVLTELPAKKSGATAQPSTLTGWAEHAEYHASDQVLHLTGSPRISDGESMQLAADQIDYHRDSQNASAGGHVKATYTQSQKSGTATARGAAPEMGGKGPVHIVADRATLDHARDQEFFYGTVRDPARMWQDPDSLLAPVIEIDRSQNLLKAQGAEPGHAPVVSANFTTTLGGQQQASVVRVHSETLVYSDKTRQADFRGSVQAAQGDEAVHADEAVLYLKPAAGNTPRAQNPPKAAAPAAGAASKQNSQLDRMIATGHVVFLQPGRRGNGDKLVYTADDGRYVLTGSEAAPPQMWDRVHGTTTGVALIFNSRDDTVQVSGGKLSAVTETRAKK